MRCKKCFGRLIMKRFYSFTNTIGIYKLLGICFFVGIVVGTIVANLFKGFYINDFFLFQDSYYQTLKSEELNSFVVFQMALIRNVKSFGLLVLLATTMIGTPCFLAHATYKGFGVGFLISTAAMRFGINGILFCLGYLFPHGLLLFPLLLITYVKGYQLNYQLYAKNDPARIRLSTYIPLLLLLLLIILIGSLLEGYFNAGLLRQLMLHLSQ